MAPGKPPGARIWLPPSGDRLYYYTGNPRKVKDFF
jgi:hypothetical protein